VLGQVVAPLLSWLRSREATHEDFLWWVRYGRRGEHVKVRIHGSGRNRDEVRRELAELAEACFASWGEPSMGERSNWARLPPIDLEDTGTELQPEPSVLWTSYQRSAINLAARPFLDSDDYVAAATSCLAAGGETALQSWKLDQRGQSSATARQGLLLQLLISALPVLCSERNAIGPYLAYHRDWLLRFRLSRRGPIEKDAVELSIRGLDAQVDQRRDQTLQPIVRVLASRWGAAEASEAESLVHELWRSRLAELRSVVRRLTRDVAFHIDLYAPRPEFATYFKALHGMANQLGIDMLNESYVHHLLLRAWETFPEPVRLATVSDTVTTGATP
jgi:Lantibiotic biosynthesis dehydratase C-term